MRPRCYREFCNRRAIRDVTDYGPRLDMEHPDYYGEWGYCDAHWHTDSPNSDAVASRAAAYRARWGGDR